MARILYGVSGEGMGHATRAGVIIGHLTGKGHKVHIVTSNRAFSYLKKLYPKSRITRIPGLALVYENNALIQLKSAFINMKFKERRLEYETVKRIIKKENIQLIITDYEPAVAYMSKLIRFSDGIKKKLPLISIDNLHLSSNCKVDVPIKFRKDYLLTNFVNKLIIPYYNVNKFLVVTFFTPKIKNKKTRLIPLILRDLILKTRTRQKNHILVYQTSKSNTKMFGILKKFKKEKFIVYGFDENEKESNLTFKKFSEKGFVRDLADSKAVITNGGFSLIGEAIFMHKPVMSIPVKKHFEQICNAISLKKEGYGMFCEELNEYDLRLFFKNLGIYRKNIQNYKQKDNKKMLEIVDETINEVLSNG